MQPCIGLADLRETCVSNIYMLKITCLLEGNGADCIVHCDESDKLRRGVVKSTKKFAVVNCRLRSESA
ncbi:hypothetical protein T09_15621 [Trichinella sp. T9]|nr:hypothetical protein T09_15621 [Trichinella sp. T9]